MTFYVYIILCKGGSYYTGYTKDVEERVRLHSNGRGSRYTKMYPPKKVVYVEQFETRSEAMKREKAIKKLSHKQKQDLTKLYKLKQVTERNAGVANQEKTNREEFETKKSTRNKPSWNEKLHNNKDLPKIVAINEKMSVKWGIGTMVIPSPLEVDEFMRKVPEGKVTTINEIRAAIAKKHGATIGCPMTTGIFSWIAAHAADERAQHGDNKITPYWRTLKTGGFLNEKYPGGCESQKQLLENEGHVVLSKGKRFVVNDYEKVLV